MFSDSGRDAVPGSGCLNTVGDAILGTKDLWRKSRGVGNSCGEATLAPFQIPLTASLLGCCSLFLSIKASVFFFFSKDPIKMCYLKLFCFAPNSLL